MQSIQETPCSRSYFYVGGTYVRDEDGQHYLRDQLYVEQLAPVGGPTMPYPLLFVHGQGMTGTNWLNKPDGGIGWASRFIQQGYQVYILDQPSRGRSPTTSQRAATTTSMSVEQFQHMFTAPGPDAWPQARRHTQWPGTGKMGDAVFDAFYASGVPYVPDTEYLERAAREAGRMLLERIGKEVIIVGHSQGGGCTFVIADEGKEFVKGLVLLEPRGPPFRKDLPWGLSFTPMSYTPTAEAPTDITTQTHSPRDAESYECTLQAETSSSGGSGSGSGPRKLTNLAGKKVLVVTAEASYHAQYDHCTVAFLKQAGVAVEAMDLKEHGIRGNGHMFFLEKNSDEIQELVEGWMKQAWG